MKAIHKGKSKNDRIDSSKIAALVRGGASQAYVHPRAIRSTRDLLCRRRYFVRKWSTCSRTFGTPTLITTSAHPSQPPGVHWPPPLRALDLAILGGVACGSHCGFPVSSPCCTACHEKPASCRACLDFFVCSTGWGRGARARGATEQPRGSVQGEARDRGRDHPLGGPIHGGGAGARLVVGL
jgi:hypothetical protein